ncbi:NUDIX hydrolase [uncultured Clostridium sp.]|jgi:mutator protein MutT|uniref:NUDIX hydrolase n=1 Tax=uncultured Clostridium sp. TaxID=59620 RepID=UPI00262832C9|nr:NUDIX hydrolase [uncultured Clostridium sp.]
MGYIMDLRKELKNEKRALIMPAAGVLIINKEGKVLLQQRTDNSKWGLPGGSMEVGETFEETATREAFEEVGLKVTDLDIFNVYSGEDLHYTYPNGHEVYIATCVYICRDTYSGELKMDPEETKDAKFYSKNELPDMREINPPDRVVIRDLLKKEIL